MALGEEAQKELADALRIFREDHVIKNLAEIKRHLKIGMEEASPEKAPDEKSSEPEKDPGEGDPPPAEDKPKDLPKSKHSWWGEL